MPKIPHFKSPIFNDFLMTIEMPPGTGMGPEEVSSDGRIYLATNQCLFLMTWC